MQAEEQIKRIQVKLQQLLREYAVLQKENEQLKTDLNIARQQASLQQENIESLKQQAAILQYKQGELSGPDKKEFEKKVNSYLKEIDRCIALLSQ